MLRDPNNPNHHKYVNTNKYQRKKKQNVIFNLVAIFRWNKTLNDTENFRNLYNYDEIPYRNFPHYKNYENKPNYLNTPGCKIIWDDVNHISYRIIKNGDFIRKYGKIQHFKRI